jgi:4'-phosphopantetheinyl transferase
VIDFPPRAPGDALPLAGGELHLWAVPLDPPPERLAAYGETLAGDEWTRAWRFRFEVHRRRFIAGRGALRALLGAYLGLPPARLAFTYGERGKPDLAPGCGGGTLFFNLSHSHELGLLAVTRAREVGVDVEHAKPMPDLERIAERFFAAEENAALLALPPAEQERAFFRCWTRKEAYLKAVGVGLAAPLDSFVVTLTPGTPARMLALRGDPAAGARWRLWHLEPAPGYLGAVAIEGADPVLRGWTLAA